MCNYKQMEIERYMTNEEIGRLITDYMKYTNGEPLLFAISGWSLDVFFIRFTRQFCVCGLLLCLLGGNGGIFIKNYTQKI